MPNLNRNLPPLLATLATILSLCLVPAHAHAEKAQHQDSAGAVPHNPTQPTAEAILFRPNFTVGNVTAYEFTASVKAEQAIDELKMSSQTGTHLIIRLEVLEVNPQDGTATIKMTYDRVALNGANSMSNASYTFDSAADPQTNRDFQVAAVLSRLKDAELQATVSKNGLVLAVTGHESVLAAMARNENLKGRIGEFNQEGLKQVLEGFWRVGETEIPRAVPTSWTESQTMQMPSVGTLTFATVFNLLDADADEARFNVILDVTLELQKDQETDTTDEKEETGTIQGENDPDNSVLSPEAKARAEERAFQESLPAAERAELTTEKRPGILIWDRQRHELLERETFLNFTLEIEQFEIFSQTMQTSFSLYDVTSKWHRIATE